jgi:hypothetical protein
LIRVAYFRLLPILSPREPDFPAALRWVLIEHGLSENRFPLFRIML